MGAGPEGGGRKQMYPLLFGVFGLRALGCLGFRALGFYHMVKDSRLRRKAFPSQQGQNYQMAKDRTPNG